MARRFFAVALALGLGGWTVAAQGRTTFVLSDGERVSGALNSSTGTGGQFSLAIPGQRDRVFRNGEVAVIEFGGGQPRDDELTALPGGGQMIALRNGELRRGSLVGISAGATVRWRDQGGSLQNIPVRDVARIYVNPRNARNAYANSGYGRGYTGGYDSRSGQGYSGSSAYDSRSSGQYGSNQYGQNRNTRNRPNNNLANPIDVQAQAPWTDSGIDVMRGDSLRFDAQGQVTFIQGANSQVGPAGGSAKNQRYPVNSAGVGALIAKVGNNGTPFLIGDNRNAVSMPATGRLWLGVNDDNFSDNAGAFKVTVISGQ